MIPGKEGKFRGEAQPLDLIAVQLNSQHWDTIPRQTVGMSMAVHSWENKRPSARAITQIKHHLSPPSQQLGCHWFPQSQTRAQCQPPAMAVGHLGGSSTFLWGVLIKPVTSWFSSWVDFHNSSCTSRMYPVFSPGAGWYWRPGGTAEDAWAAWAVAVSRGKLLREDLEHPVLIFGCRCAEDGDSLGDLGCSFCI